MISVVTFRLDLVQPKCADYILGFVYSTIVVQLQVILWNELPPLSLN